MAYETREGQGSLFKNKHKEPDDNKPSMKGYVVAHRDIKQGEKIEVAAWTKTDRNGERYQSLQLSDIRIRDDADATPADQGPDIPF